MYNCFRDSKILVIYSDKRIEYFIEALRQNNAVETLKINCNSNELFFWKNLLLTGLELIGSMVKEKKFKSLDKNTLISNAYRRPQLRGKLTLKATKVIKEMTNKPDIIIQWSSMYAPYINDLKIPFIIVLDNYVDPPETIHKRDTLRKSWTTIYDKSLFLFQKELYSKAKHVFTFSKWCRDGLIIDHGLSKEKVAAIGWGPAKEVSVTKEFEHKQHKNILAVGTDYKGKGIDVLLEAAEYLSDFSITIVGRDASKLNFKAPSNVKILGFISDNELKDLYNKSELFFIFSGFDPSPHVIWEAQALGCIIVGYDAYGISESVIDGETGLLLKTRDPKSVANSINHLYDDPSKVKEMQKNAVENYLKNGTWSKVCENIEREMNCRL